MIKVRDLSFSYGRKRALNGLSLHIPKGGITGIAGPNGSGKSTLFRLLVRMLRPESGAIFFDGIPLTDVRPADLARRMAFVAAEPQFQFRIRVSEFIAMGRFPHTRRRFGWLNREDKTLISQACALTETEVFLPSFFNDLSSGEKQRVQLAKALVGQPEVLLLDESISHLDLKYRNEFSQLIKTLNTSRKTTVAIISHDINFLSRFCDYIILMKQGRTLAEGPPRQIITATQISSLFDTSIKIIRDEGNNPFITL